VEGFDVIVVGSGAAGMAAACVAAGEGCSVLLLEQALLVGGTTAISGGMVWLPANHRAAAAGMPDTLDAARSYLGQTVPGQDRSRIESFLRHGGEALRYLEERTALRLQPVPTYPDYYPELPGATLRGRVLEPQPYDGRALGRDFALLRPPLPEFTLFGGMMISRQDIPHLRRVGRSARSALHVAGLLGRHALQRLRAARGTSLYLGNALAARLLQSVRQCGVQLRTGARVERLLRGAAGRVVGIDVVDAGGARASVLARRGVILATGGLSHCAELRARFVPPQAGSLSATVGADGAVRGARLALEAGAQLSQPTQAGAFWVPASVFTRRDGSQGVFPHTVTDRAKPGLIAVGRDGRRFVNEAVSYHEFVRAQLALPDRASPAWLVCDARFLWKYGLGRVRPFAWSVRAEVAQGYLKRAASIAALADAIDVPAAALQDTLDDYNQHAREGRDPAFGRGGDAYQRHLGDAGQQPNPCVAPIDRGPFYAVAVWPADLGMSAGIVTDDGARVLSSAGAPIPGLYACGNDMASVMEGAYPGPGITLGPALTFAYLAARDAARSIPHET
jgi:succinate dehydrogenase/fumarate reductase flavoprotein subunit